MSAVERLGQARTSRRIVFHGLGALGVAAALAGCGGGDDEGGDGSANGGALEAGTRLATTDEIPVGGGLILTEQKVVLTQPTEGEIKAFTAICTHQQLLVTSVAEGRIQCANHGSVYDAATGEVLNPPATDPLAEVPITVDGDQVLAA